MTNEDDGVVEARKRVDLLIVSFLCQTALLGMRQRNGETAKPRAFRISDRHLKESFTIIAFSFVSDVLAAFRSSEVSVVWVGVPWFSHLRFFVVVSFSSFSHVCILFLWQLSGSVASSPVPASVVCACVCVFFVLSLIGYLRSFLHPASQWVVWTVESRGIQCRVAFAGR